ncbi:type II toxin-antitoxin system VapC family toxin [Mongoliimonas terrestris]|uniref:type II toxin-antitoxin system VapC family toxin n=1 Tax=Mongoliimonas terrestris TaxID=1709001 RepID=UPI00094974D6|nr:type II toxin-antitoxin system VapC family toxin [Mongoliimonas terrestris]
MPAGRIYLDTNVLIHALEREDDLAFALVDLMVAVDFDGQPLCVTSALAFSEALVRPAAEGNRPAIDLYTGCLRNGTTTLDIRPITADVLVTAAFLRGDRKGLKLPDAIHLATGLATGCGSFLTSDRGLTGSFTWNASYGGTGMNDAVMIIARPSLDEIAQLRKAAAE